MHESSQVMGFHERGAHAEEKQEESEADLALLSEHGRLMAWLRDAGFPFRRLPLGGVDGFSRNELMAVAGVTGLKGKTPAPPAGRPGPGGAGRA